MSDALSLAGTETSANPFQTLVEFAWQIYREEEQRDITTGWRSRPPMIEIVTHIRDREIRLYELCNAALGAAHKTGIPIPDVEERINALESACKSLLFWTRDVPAPSKEQQERNAKPPVSMFLYKGTVRQKWAGRKTQREEERLAQSDNAGPYLVEQLNRLGAAIQPVNRLAALYEGQTAPARTDGAYAMPHVGASAPPLTVADIDAAKQAATDCIEAAVSVRAILHATDYPLPDDLPGHPPPGVHETLAMLLEGLNQAVAGEPHIAKVEPYFPVLGPVELPGVGIEANWHRLALRFALIARGAIINGMAEAAREQMHQSAGEWLDAKTTDPHVPKALTARAKADAERCERLIIREPGKPPRRPQAADEIAAVVVPRTWRVIRSAIGGPMEIDLGALSAGVAVEKNYACRSAAAAPDDIISVTPTIPYTTSDPQTNSEMILLAFPENAEEPPEPEPYSPAIPSAESDSHPVPLADALATPVRFAIGETAEGADKETPIGTVELQRPPDFSAWGLGTDGTKWCLFEQCNETWLHRKCLENVNAGRQGKILNLFLSSRGRFTMADAIKAIPRLEGTGVLVARDGVKQDISRLRAIVLKAMGYKHTAAVNARPDPFEWDMTAYNAKVWLGTVDITDDVQEGDKHRQRFKPMTNPTHDQ